MRRLIKCSVFVLLLGWAFSSMAVSRERKPWDRLEIYGNKEILFSNYHVKGDFNQFLQKNPGIITDSKFDQRTRIQVRGEIGEDVEVQAIFDDSNFKEDNEKILLHLKGDAFEMALGRISLDMEGTRFILNNRKALGIFIKKRTKKLQSSLLISRSEGKEERDTFQGQGLTREYLLTKSPVVAGSEKITLDGQELREGSDYRMDYEGGSFQLDHQHLPVENTSTIIVEYESAREGSAFKNRIFGTRHTYSWEPGQEIGLSYVLEKDQVSREFASILNTTPHQLSVIGLDTRVRIADDFSLKMEVAHSQDKQDILSHSLPVLKGNAIDLALDWKRKGHQLQLRKERIEPEFRSVGKNAFLRQGEDSSLLGDIDQDSLHYQWNHDPFTYRQFIRTSKTNLDSDPLKETREFQGVGSEVHGKLFSKLELSAGLNQENHPRYFQGTQSSYDVLRKKHLKLEYPTPYGIRVAVQSQNEKKGTIGRKEEYFQDRSMNLYSTKQKNWNWNYGMKLRDTNDNFNSVQTSSSRDHKLSVSYKNGRKVQTQADFVLRDDDHFQQGTKGRSVSSGFDFRYRPTRKFDYSMKWKQEEKKRVILETSQVDLSKDLQEQEKKTYLTPTNPIQSVVSSQRLRYRQNSKLFHRFTHRFRSEKERIRDQVLSENETFHYDLKWDLPSDLRFRYQWRWNDRYNLNSSLDRNANSHDYEFVKNFRRSATLTASFKDQVESDYWLNSKLNLSDGSLRWDQTLSRLFRTHGVLIGREKKGSENSREWSVGGGIIYTPGFDKLRIGMEISKGRVDQKDIGQAGNLEEIELSVNQELFEGAFLEGKYRFEKEGPSIKGTGYTGGTYHLRVSMDF